MAYVVGSLVIIFAGITTLLMGKWFSMHGRTWYKKLKLPHFSPPRLVYSILWTFIFALATVSAILTLQADMPTETLNLIMLFFLLNAVLNVAWSWLFFYHKNILAALLDAMALLATIFVLMHMLKPVACGASLLLVPYAVWVCYAIVLNDAIWQFNKPHQKGFSFKDFFRKQSI
jgi:tryptophan-rich sensory protein